MLVLLMHSRYTIRCDKELESYHKKLKMHLIVKLKVKMAIAISFYPMNH